MSSDQINHIGRLSKYNLWVVRTVLRENGLYRPIFHVYQRAIVQTGLNQAITIDCLFRSLGRNSIQKHTIKGNKRPANKEQLALAQQLLGANQPLYNFFEQAFHAIGPLVMSRPQIKELRLFSLVNNYASNEPFKNKAYFTFTPKVARRPGTRKVGVADITESGNIGKIETAGFSVYKIKTSDIESKIKQAFPRVTWTQDLAKTTIATSKILHSYEQAQKALDKQIQILAAAKK